MSISSGISRSSSVQGNSTSSHDSYGQADAFLPGTSHKPLSLSSSISHKSKSQHSTSHSSGAASSSLPHKSKSHHSTSHSSGAAHPSTHASSGHHASSIN